MKRIIRGLLIIWLIAGGVPSRAQTPQPQKTKPSAVETVAPPDQDVETLKIDTNLVTVPVIASSRTGTYISDLQKEEFNLTEDGVPQQIAFLASIDVPFHVVLLLDTSNSTQDKLPQIQRAAIAFLEQLGPKDRVKIVSFDSELHDWNDFTADKAVLRNAISQTRTGTSTRVYDAVQLALNVLRPIQQRRAIVVFTDGVDWHSESSTYDSTIRDLDESGVIVYPIRFDTRAETERLARQQDASTNGVGLPTRNVIRTPPIGTTPTTFPGDDPFPVPQQQKRSTLPLPDPSVIFGRRTGQMPPRNPNEPFPDPDTNPLPDDPRVRDRNRVPGSNDPRARDRDRFPSPDATGGPANDDRITVMMKALYFLADGYLKDLADRTGGQVYRADTVATLPQAFAAIAAELRTQYLLGYYPINKNTDGAYRKIQVKTSRKDIAVRARPGYRAKSAR